MSTLGAPLTVLWAITTLGVDDRASIEGIAHEVLGDLVCCLVEFFLIRGGEQSKCLVFGDLTTGEDTCFDVLDHSCLWVINRVGT